MTMLHGANLKMKYWPYAFYHYLRIHNMTPHGSQDKMPNKLLTGQRPDISYLRTFGCPIIALPPQDRRPDKLHNAPRHRTFLGFSQTSRNAIYLDKITNNVRYTSDIEFDEGEESMQELSPHGKALQRRSDHKTTEEAESIPTIPLDVSTAPWINPEIITVALQNQDH